MAIIIGIDPRFAHDWLWHYPTNGRQTNVYRRRHDSYRYQRDALERLKRIFNGLTRITQHHLKYGDEPIYTAIEQVFMAENPDSALKLALAVRRLLLWSLLI